jgi:hypothetical protein
MNQNVNAYYMFLGVHYFHECVHRWGTHTPLVQSNKPMYKYKLKTQKIQKIQNFKCKREET